MRYRFGESSCDLEEEIIRRLEELKSESSETSSILLGWSKDRWRKNLRSSGHKSRNPD